MSPPPLLQYNRLRFKAPYDRPLRLPVSRLHLLRFQRGVSLRLQDQDGRRLAAPDVPPDAVLRPRERWHPGGPVLQFLPDSSPVSCPPPLLLIPSFRCWQCLPQSVHKDKPFVTLVTSAFPSSKDQEKLLKELEEANFFDCFNLDATTNRWNCFSCSYPDKVRSV